MRRYIAFLRAINVGGHVVKMTELKRIFVELGFSNVETFIASGNVIFTAKNSANSAMVKKIESALHKALGYEVAVFIRTDTEVCALAAQQAFSDAEVHESFSISVGMLSEPLSAAAVQVLHTFNTDTERFRTTGREIHFLSQITMADSNFSNAKFERSLGVQVSFRNVKTIARLANKYPGAK